MQCDDVYCQGLSDGVLAEINSVLPPMTIPVTTSAKGLDTDILDEIGTAITTLSKTEGQPIAVMLLMHKTGGQDALEYFETHFPRLNVWWLGSESVGEGLHLIPGHKLPPGILALAVPVSNNTVYQNLHAEFKRPWVASEVRTCSDFGPCLLACAHKFAVDIKPCHSTSCVCFLVDSKLSTFDRVRCRPSECHHRYWQA